MGERKSSNLTMMSEIGSVKSESVKPNTTGASSFGAGKPLAEIEEEGSDAGGVGEITKEVESNADTLGPGQASSVLAETLKGATNAVAEPEAGFDGAEDVPTKPPPS